MTVISATLVSVTLRRLCLGALLAAPVAVLVPHAALAQHVVTEDEAAKLNFDSLTAAPAPVYHASVRHVSYRSVVHHGRAGRTSHTRSAARDNAMVHLVGAHHVVNTKRAHGQHRRS